MAGRIPITDVAPIVDCGAFPAKSAVGEMFTVSATVFREGHDAVNCNVLLTSPTGRRRRLRMHPDGQGLDRWHTGVRLDVEGDWSFCVEGWSDPYGTWEHNAGIKIPAGIDTELMCAEGAAVLSTAADGVPPAVRRDRETLATAVGVLKDASVDPAQRFAAGTSAAVTSVLARYPLRELLTSSETYTIRVDRRRAVYSSWYEFFPRSLGAEYVEGEGWRSGTFTTAAERLPAVAEMGFDIIYLPPIHPIGTAFRKGANNTLTPGPDDPGSPWAIGAPEGGHDSIHPDLGDFDDFDAFVARARGVGLEVALDLALQASPDHPWVKEHPEWFTIQVDGSIAYAENPPKKYQDIYPVNFDNDPEGIYAEVLRIVRLWISHGVTIFRVDNPHTKPPSFWHRLLGAIHETDPHVLFLAEAFTRPPMMQYLAKVGFHQSYSYFTWRNSKDELAEFLTDVSQDTGHFMRPNMFVNTPDILHAFLQYGGPPAFKIRAALAATGSPNWGVYSGFELYEHVALRPGSEEYLDTEKFSYRPRDFAAAEAEGRSLAPYLTMLNHVRQRHPALQELRNIVVHDTDDDAVLAFSKRTPGLEPGQPDDVVIVVANLDPHGTRETMVHLDTDVLGLPDSFAVHDEVTGQVWGWGSDNYVRLDPFHEPVHILSVRTGEV